MQHLYGDAKYHSTVNPFSTTGIPVITINKKLPNIADIDIQGWHNQTVATAVTSFTKDAVSDAAGP